MPKPKSYKDYLKQGNKISPEKLAPAGAIPKYSKGDSAKYRFNKETIKKRGETVELSEYNIVPYATQMHKRRKK